MQALLQYLRSQCRYGLAVDVCRILYSSEYFVLDKTLLVLIVVLLLSRQTDQAVIYIEGKEGGRQDCRDVISVGYVDDVKEKAFVSAHYILYFLLGAAPFIQCRRKEWAQTVLRRLFEESNFVFEAHAQHRRHKGTVDAVNINTAKARSLLGEYVETREAHKEIRKLDILIHSVEQSTEVVDVFR